MFKRLRIDAAFNNSSIDRPGLLGLPANGGEESNAHGEDPRAGICSGVASTLHRWCFHPTDLSVGRRRRVLLPRVEAWPARSSFRRRPFRSRKLSSDEWQSLLDALTRSDFWKLPSWRGGGGVDGAQWIVEARVGARYHVVDRWTPQPGSFRDLGLLFLKLSGLSIPERQIY